MHTERKEVNGKAKYTLFWWGNCPKKWTLIEKGTRHDNTIMNLCDSSTGSG
jgi:hypothetical protein